ncbi:hypothetical protein BGZ50_002070 [Haplosporangium sp. Z 11]|nr:hypothetical protein BGZ50_002070 [Haplosporangium sp. Z 11]
MSPHSYLNVNPQIPSAMALLNHINVERELKQMAKNLVQKHRLSADENGTVVAPSLFVILPALNSYSHANGLGGAHSNNDNYNYNNYNNCDGQHQNRPRNSVVGATDRNHQDAVDYRLFFLCDYGTREDVQPKLHICDYPHPNNPTSAWIDDSISSDMEIEPSPQLGYHHHHEEAQPLRGESGVNHNHNGHNHGHGRNGDDDNDGFRLQDLQDFLDCHAMPMLSLLCALQDNPDGAFMPGTGGAFDPALARRIRTAIQFLAGKVHEALLDIHDNPTVSDSDGYDDDDEGEDGGSYGSEEIEVSRLQERDFLDKGIGAVAIKSGGRIDTKSGKEYGGLCQMSSAMMFGDGILWLCRTHNEMFCKAPAAEMLRQFIKSHNGDCIPMEKSAEIQLFRREDARAFYALVREYQCIMKLKISLAWNDGHGQGGVTEQDLWELCDVVHASNLRELTVDCCADAAGYHQPQLGTAAQTRLSFKPLLGMLCRPGFVSLAVENFDGDIFPGITAFHTQGNAAEFSLERFKRSSTLVVPENIQLKKLVFRHWTHYPDIQGLTAVVRCCKSLTELETETEKLEDMFVSIHLATELGNLAYIHLSESSRESAEMTIVKNERKIQRRTCRAISPYLQQVIGLENLTVLECTRLWDSMGRLFEMLENNINTLKGLDLACQTEYLGKLWTSIAHKLIQIQSADNSVEPIRLRLNDQRGHCIESLCPQRFDKTSLVLGSYDESFRPYIQALSRVAATLCVGHEFTNVQQLALLLQHVTEDGLYFHAVDWFLTPETLVKPEFINTLRTLIHRPEVQKFTIRLDGDNEGYEGVDFLSYSYVPPIQTLLLSWNAVTGMSLSPEAYGRWLQEVAAQQDHPFAEQARVPNGNGELTFASEDHVEFGAPAALCPSSSSTDSAPYRGSSRVYSLSCRPAQQP